MNYKMNQLRENMMLLRYYNKYEKHFTQKDIAEILTIPQTQISRIENDITTPRLNEVIKYANFFQISLDDLVYKKYDRTSKTFNQR